MADMVTQTGPDQVNVSVRSGIGMNELNAYNIKAYGAVGDGVTDDTTAIQTAINAATAGGGTLYAPQGDYLVSGNGMIVRNTDDDIQVLWSAYGARFFRNEDPDPAESSGKPILTIGAVGEKCWGVDVRGGSYDFAWDGAAHTDGGDTFSKEQWLVDGSDCIRTINMRHGSIDDVQCRYGRTGINMIAAGTSAYLGTGTLTTTGASTVVTVDSGVGDLAETDSFRIHYATTDNDDDSQFDTLIAADSVITDITGSAVTFDFNSTGMTAADMDTVYWVSSTGGDGSVYNTLSSNRIVNCYTGYGLEMLTDGAWVNENVFNGGSVAYGEDIASYSTNATDGRCVRYTPLTYHSNVMNNNRFVDMSLEGTYAKMVKECGAYKTSDRVGLNSYIRCRCEGLTTPLFDFGAALTAKDIPTKYEQRILVSKPNPVYAPIGLFAEADYIGGLNTPAASSNVQHEDYNRFSGRTRSSGYSVPSYAVVEVNITDSNTYPAFAVRDTECAAETGVELYGQGEVWLEPKTSMAGAGVKQGGLYYDSSVDKLMRYDGSSWDEIGPWDSHTNLIDGAWTDLAVPASSQQANPANTPSRTAWKSNLYLPAFTAAGAGTQRLDLEGLQVPHGYVPGTDWLWHVHFTNDAVIPDGDTVTFNLRYTVSAPYTAFPAEAVLGVTFTNDQTWRDLYPDLVDGSDNVKVDSHLLATTGTRAVDGTDLAISSVLVGVIERNAADTFAGDALLMSADFHIYLDRLGSENEYSG